MIMCSTRCLIAHICLSEYGIYAHLSRIDDQSYPKPIDTAKFVIIHINITKHKNILLQHVLCIILNFLESNQYVSNTYGILMAINVIRKTLMMFRDNNK